MPLFELQRIWDAWPQIQDVQLLRDLFRQLSPVGPLQAVSGVFLIPGHLFIAITETGGSLPTASLYAFSCTAQTRSADRHLTDHLLPLSEHCTGVLAVVDRTVEGICRHQCWVVIDSGELLVFDFDTESHQWSFRESVQLFASGRLLNVCVNGSTIVYCGRGSGRGRGEESEWDCQTYARSFASGTDGSVAFGTPTSLLTQSPPLLLLPWGMGVCLMPTPGSTAPAGLMLLWQPGMTTIEPCVWNSSSALPPLPLLTTFRTAVLHTAGVWTQAPHEPSLVTMATHPVTNQLLALGSDGGIHELSTEDGVTYWKVLVCLSDYTQRYPASGSAALRRPDLFCQHTYYGLCLTGTIRLYDCFTGEFVWEEDEHEGSGTRLWRGHTPSLGCGLLTDSGVWIMRSRRIAEHAHFMAKALFPVATNADETTPGDYLDQGCVVAARLCKLWGLELLATRYALDAAYGAVLRGRGGKKEEEKEEGEKEQAFLPELSPELLKLFSSGSLQNPALLVALLGQYPKHRHLVSGEVEAFLRSYYTNSQQRNSCEKLTQLNAEIAPLLENYLSLSREYDDTLTKSLPSCVGGGLLRVQGVVREGLQSYEQSLDQNEGDIVSLRSELLSLSHAHPQQALFGIRDFFGVTSFREAVGKMQSGQWPLEERNWRGVFASDSAPQTQASSYLQGSSPHLPLFELTCRLLYSACPSELLHFVRFAQLSRDHQAGNEPAYARRCRRNFFYHRALDALPQFVSPETTPTPPDAIHVHCQLLLESEHAHCELVALQLLVHSRLWQEAIALVEQTKAEALPASHTARFHCLITHLAKGGVLKQHLEKVWTLLPDKFSVFDFLSILRSGAGYPPEESPVLLPGSSQELNVSDVAQRLLALIPP